MRVFSASSHEKFTLKKGGRERKKKSGRQSQEEKGSCGQCWLLKSPQK